jgi:hypothetical protein
MGTPEHEKAEQLRRDMVAQAWALLEKHREFPSVIVELNDADQELRESRPEEAKGRLSEARLEYLLRVLDAHGKAYLRLVVDLESVKAIATVMDDFAREMWWQFSGVPPELIPPTTPFVKPQPEQAQRTRIFDRAHHWTVEGYRCLAAIQRMGPTSPSCEPSDKPPVKTISDRLDDAATHRGISHEEQASRIHISRTAYFEVKAGRGGKKSRRKTENYLSRVFNDIDRKSEPNKD